jgi:hypothetical protein
MSGTWRDALGALGKDNVTFGEDLLKTRIDYFLTTADWKFIDGDVNPRGPSDHRLIWLEARAKEAATNDNGDDDDARIGVSRVFAILLLTVAVGCDTKPATPATWGPPARTIRFASYNTFKSSRGRDAILADIRSKSPDIVFLQEVPVELPEETARALGMYHAFPQAPELSRRRDRDLLALAAAKHSACCRQRRSHVRVVRGHRDGRHNVHRCDGSPHGDDESEPRKRLVERERVAANNSP